MSKVLQGAKFYYHMLERAPLAIVVSNRRLRHYFHGHSIIIKIDLPIRQVDIVGRMVKWSIKLSKLNISYKPRDSIKSQVLVDFITKLTFPIPTSNNDCKWIFSFNGATNLKSSNTSIILEGPNEVLIQKSLRFSLKERNKRGVDCGNALGKVNGSF